MTDKVQKIRKEIERIQLYSQSETLSQVLDYIDKVEKEPDDIWKPADGDYLPEIDKEVIVLTQNYPMEGSEYAVSFAHRPYKGKYIGKSLTTGNIETFENKTYDKGGWNIPDVKFWLDCDFPKEKEE